MPQPIYRYVRANRRLLEIAQEYSVFLNHCAHSFDLHVCIANTSQDEVTLGRERCEVRLAVQHIKESFALLHNALHIGKHTFQVSERLNCGNMTRDIYFERTLRTEHVTCNPYGE